MPSLASIVSVDLTLFEPFTILSIIGSFWTKEEKVLNAVSNCSFPPSIRTISGNGLIFALLILSSDSYSLESISSQEKALSEKLFSLKVRAILSSKCFSCHGSDNKFKGGLNLTSLYDLMRGGESGEPGLDDRSRPERQAPHRQRRLPRGAHARRRRCPRLHALS